MNLKYISSLSILASLGFGACADLDKEFEDNIMMESTKNSVVEKMPSRTSGELNGMYNIMASPNPMGYSSGTADDGGYPLMCAFFDMNGPDSAGDDSGYNWLSTPSEWSDRHDNYRNPYMRWALFYKQIKAANDILNSTDPNESEAKRHLYGQALCVRAFDYLNLAPYYQYSPVEKPSELCVPIVDGSKMLTEVARNTTTEVYDFIIADLTKAIELLDGYKRTSQANADQSVAYGLRARANLVLEKWSDAASDATKAIEVCDGAYCDGTPYSMKEVSSPTSSFYKFDHNWMWGIKMTETMVNGAYASWPSWIGSFSTNAYSTGVAVYDRINVLLWSIIPQSDIRKGWWVDENLHSDHLNGVTWSCASATLTGDEIATKNIDDIKMPYIPYTNVKFGFDPQGDLSKNGGDWPIMRVEEMILIQAEAYAKAGDEAKGKQILSDFVKQYRNPEYTQYCKTFSDEVWMQRRIELWGEGFSMFDIMRLRKPVVRVNSRIPSNFPDAFQFNLAHEDPIMLAIIPQSEMTSNALMVQNPIGHEPTTGDGEGLLDGVTD
ncbi:MAG: RagB/SusD family nutrient uptake outer membrane protein [Bacteroidales bacterium]|nr:RagB/SusD family nutrient uptake outer membrane protein [Bacteroidales bacterium]